MRQKTKKKIIRWSILALLSILIVGGLLLAFVLGPFRSLWSQLPGLMGLYGTKNYLILIQNNSELRPTGGFITGVVEVSAFLGMINTRVFDSYQIPDPKPKLPAPEPFNYFIGQHDPFFAGWTLRDANFSPDFPTSSQAVISLYQQAFPEKKIQGVLALDFQVIEALLDLYGPITVEETQLTSENFFLQTQRLTKDIDTHDAGAVLNRKNLLKPFASELLKRILKTPTKYREFFSLLFELAHEKHVLAYSTFPGIQKKIQSFTMDQSLTAPEDASQDFLHVNIANIGGRKSDRYVLKDIRYRVDLSNPEVLQGILRITLEHFGSYNLQSDIYQAFVRVYTPKGTKLLSSSGSDLKSTAVSEEFSLRVFSDYLRLSPGESVTLEYRYQLPSTFDVKNYRLQILKQPGLEGQRWRVVVQQKNDSSMTNAPASASDTQAMTIQEDMAFWQGELKHDLSFHLLQESDQQGPLILWQEFEDLNTLNVRFQEPLDPVSTRDPTHFLLSDLDLVSPRHDEVKVQSVSIGFQGQDLHLKLSGVTRQPEERYQITIRDIADQQGNLMTPNPLARTVVQRIKP